MSDDSSTPDATSEPDTTGNGGLLKSEDWWAVWLGGAILLACLGTVWSWCASRPDEFESTQAKLAELDEEIDHLSTEVYELEEQSPEPEADASSAKLKSTELADARKARRKLLLTLNPISDAFKKPATWSDNPLNSFSGSILPGLLGAFAVGAIAFGLGGYALGTCPGRFLGGYVVVFLLATFAYVLAAQEVVKHYNLEYALWALVVGLLISNTVGTPAFVKPAVRTEFYIKTGLVLLGAGVLLSRLLVLGLPGVFVAWVVTPIVLIGTFWFGQKILRIESPSLNMVISADMSVCGVSAAIATAAACKAKKEELSLAVGMSLTFTVIMMVVMPAIIKAVGMSVVLGSAWMGGTIDSTGAVAAAGAFFGDTGLTIASTVKMIQNILIGVTAFGVAVYWVTSIEKGEGGTRPDAGEIWRRFPKFVLGFVAASLVFSYVHSQIDGGADIVDATVSGSTKTLRGWFFCLAFVSIGLETNFRELAGQLKGGKPLVLYLCGQTFNLCFTLLMAWLMFEVVFRDEVREILGG